jgi:hypothetical protein
MFYKTQSVQISYVPVKVLARVDIREGRPVSEQQEPIAEKKPILKRQHSGIYAEVSIFWQLRREAFRPAPNGVA